MAVIKKENTYMGLPMNIARGNPVPLDKSEIWYSRTEMENYAKTSVVAYVGQIIQLVDETENTATAFIIANTAGDLIEVGSATLGDNKSIELTEEGVLRIVGADSAAQGAQLIMGANGEVTWVVPDTSTVAGLQTAVANNKADIKDLDERLDVAESDIDALQLKVSSLGDIFNFVGVKTLDEWSNIKAEDYDVGDVFLVENKEYVCVEVEVEGVKTKKWEPLGDPDGVSTLQSEVSTLKDKVSTLETWKAGAVTDLANAKSDITDLKAKDTELTNAIATKASNDDLATERGRINTLVQDVTDINSDIAAINTEMAGKATITYVDNKVNDINTALNNKADKTTVEELARTAATKTELQDGLDGKVDVNTYTNKIAAIETNISNVSGVANEAKTASTQNATAISGLQATVAEKADKTTVESLAGRVGTNETNIGSLQSSVNSLTGTVTDLSDKKADKTALAATDAQVALNKSASEKNAANIDALDDRVGKNEQDIIAAKEQADQGVADAAAAATAAANAMTKANEVLGTSGDASSANTVFGAKAAAAEAKSAADAAQEAADAAQDEVDALEGVVSALDSAYKTADAGLNTRIEALEGVIGGVQGAMHFVGITSKDPAEGNGVEIANKPDYAPANGDVVIFKDAAGNSIEYVYSDGAWVELGDVSEEAQRIEALEGRMDTAEVATAKIPGIESDIIGLDTALDALTLRVKANEDTNTAQATAITALETRAGNIEKSITDTAAAIRGELSDAIEALDGKIIAETTARTTAINSINTEITNINAHLTWTKFSN